MCPLEYATGLCKIIIEGNHGLSLSIVTKYPCDYVRINSYFRNENWSTYGMSNKFAFQNLPKINQEIDFKSTNLMW